MSDFNQKHQSNQKLSRQIEALLHASEMPLTQRQLCHLLAVKPSEIDTALILLQERLSHGALMVAQTAGGYRLQISSEFSPLIAQAFPERKESLSQALLETLSIIAYKQPVTRADIEQVRGVTVSKNILRRLFDKGRIVERGHKDTLGRPALLHTTENFLNAFGLTSLDELPPLPDINSVVLDNLHNINNTEQQAN